MRAPWILVLVVGVALLPACRRGDPPAARDLASRQLNAAGDGANWTLYGKTYSAWRHSPLTQINKSNVANLRVAWTLNTGMHDAFEASPVVVDGIMYFTTPWNHIYCVDAATGKEYWHYVYPLPVSIPLCCGAVNRGVAVARGKVLFTTLNAHLVALDARTGQLVWDVPQADIKQGYSGTMAPQVVENKVIAGISGGDFGIRGFIDAYDVDTGKGLWRFWTIPGAGEYGNETWTGDSWQHGGGATWMTPTYDPRTRTLFVGVGNPGPDLDGGPRPGTNLFTESTVALDVDSGKLKWYYQVLPHDVWDLDNVVEPILDDITIAGRSYAVCMFASKNGYFYCLDRTNGKCLYALPYCHKINWGTVDPDGTAHPDPKQFPEVGKKKTVYPGAAGGKEWCPVAYDPKLKRVFIPIIENGHIHEMIRQKWIGGELYWGGASVPVPDQAYGHVAAVDVQARRVVWDYRTEYPMVCGVMSTASGLVISGTPDQKLIVLDADNGRLLWQFQAVSGWHSAPVSYLAGGKQYLAFANGWGGWVAGFDLTGTPRLQGLPFDNNMYVFCLP